MPTLDKKEAKRLERFGPSERAIGQTPLVEMSTRLPNGSMITEQYKYKKIPRHP